MTLWWVANAVLFAVVIPAVVLVLVVVLRAALAVRRRAGEVADRGEPLSSGLAALADLERTPALLEDVSSGLRGYGGALDDVLPRGER